MSAPNPVNDWLGLVEEARARIAASSSSYDAEYPPGNVSDGTAEDIDDNVPAPPDTPSLEEVHPASPVSLAGDDWANEEAASSAMPSATDTKSSWPSASFISHGYDSDINIDLDNVPIPRLESSDTSRELSAFMPGDVLPTAPLLAGQLEGEGDRHIVTPGQRSYAPKEMPPPGWERLTHPNGRPFFWNRENKALTMEWILQPHIAQCVAGAVQHINERLSSLFARPSPIKYQMVIGVQPASTHPRAGMKASYYLVDLDEETVFWLDNYELRWRKVSVELRRRETVGLFLQYEFYKHWNHFPNVQIVSPAKLLRLEKILDDALSDVMFSSTSVVCFGAPEITRMIEMLARMRSRQESAQNLDVQLEGDWLPGRMMQRIYRERFMNLYGQHTVRTDRSEGLPRLVSGIRRSRSWFIAIVSPVLFNIPDKYLDVLNRLWVDNTIAVEPWRELVKEQEWEGHRLVATILLSASVSLLSVDDLPSGVVKITCFLSAISSSTSFILVTALAGRIRKLARKDILEDQMWRSLFKQPKMGPDILSVLLGLPYGLMIWATIFFAISFVSYCMSEQNVTTTSVVGAAFVLHVLVVIWSLWISQEDRSWITPKDLEQTEPVAEANKMIMDQALKSTKLRGGGGRTLATTTSHEHPGGTQTIFDWLRSILRGRESTRNATENWPMNQGARAQRLSSDERQHFWT